MRITWVLPHAGISGGIRVIATYARLLQQRGHEVVVVSTPWQPPGRRGKAWGVLRRWLHQLDPFAAHPLNPSHFDGLEIEHRVISEPRGLTDADVPDADVVVATWWETAEWVAGFSPRKGAKAYFIQGYETHIGPDVTRLEATWRLPMQKIVVARWLAEVAGKEFGDAHAAVVPNSVDRSVFHAPPRDRHAEPTVGLVYSTLHCKGCDISLKAFELAARNIPHLKLQSFGADEPDESLPLPAGAAYVHMPDDDTIRQVYSGCDAWLFGSRHEGFGLPVLEAMACRTPVIGTPAGAAGELLSAGGGILVPHEDPQNMAQAIERICTMPTAEWRGMSEAALATASRYSWDDATDLLEAAFARAIEQQSATTPAWSSRLNSAHDAASVAAH